MMLDMLQLCLQSQSVSLTPGTSTPFVLGIFVSMEPADLGTHSTGKKKRIKKYWQAENWPPSPPVVMIRMLSPSPWFAQRWCSVTLKNVPAAPREARSEQNQRKLKTYQPIPRYRFINIKLQAVTGWNTEDKMCWNALTRIPLFLSLPCSLLCEEMGKDVPSRSLSLHIHMKQRMMHLLFGLTCHRALLLWQQGGAAVSKNTLLFLCCFEDSSFQDSSFPPMVPGAWWDALGCSSSQWCYRPPDLKSQEECTRPVPHTGCEQSAVLGTQTAPLLSNPLFEGPPSLKHFPSCWRTSRWVLLCPALHLYDAHQW